MERSGIRAKAGWRLLGAVFLAAVHAGGVSAGSCKEAKLCCPGRDSSCVVQKAPINAIIEDLSDKPCYCDHACLKLGDCCADFKDACRVVDCQVTTWGPWSACDSECGPGMMSRSRTVQVKPQNGGRHCPSLQQRRGCHVSDCEHHQDAAIKEIALLLPGTLSHIRRANDTSDIRRNLRLKDPEIHADNESHREYCIEFEVLKASKSCRRDSKFGSLKEGQRICARCESDALHKELGFRCVGHGIQGKSTRWSAMSAPQCHGKWLRLQAQPDHTCSSAICTTQDSFIFV